MRVWKPALVLLILASFSGCTKETAEDTSAPPTGPAVPVLTPPPAESAAPAVSKSPGPAGSSASASKPASPAASGLSADSPPPVPSKARPAVVVPAGTEVTVVLTDSLDSGENKAGDPFFGNLGAPVVIGGGTVLKKGAKVQGRVIDAASSGRVKGLASLRLVLTGVMHDGRMIPIVTRANFIEAKETKGRDAAVIGGGAGLGAAIGAIAGGKKGAATGAIIGGAAGTGTVVATKGKEVELPAESKLTFTIDKEFRLSL